jgi:hypothetical protein
MSNEEKLSASSYIFSSFTPATAAYCALLLVPVYFFFRTYGSSSATSTSSSETGRTTQEEQTNGEETKTIMQPTRDDLLPPKDDPFTLDELKAFDGKDSSKPIYVSIKGVCCVFRCLLRTTLTSYAHSQAQSLMFHVKQKSTGLENPTTSLLGRMGPEG